MAWLSRLLPVATGNVEGIMSILLQTKKNSFKDFVNLFLILKYVSKVSLVADEACQDLQILLG